MVSQHTALIAGERYLGRIARLPAEGLILKIRSQGGISVIFMKILRAVQERVGKTGCRGTQVIKWGQVGKESDLFHSACPEQKTLGNLAVHGPLKAIAYEEWGHRVVK